MQIPKHLTLISSPFLPPSLLMLLSLPTTPFFCLLVFLSCLFRPLINRLLFVDITMKMSQEGWGTVVL